MNNLILVRHGQSFWNRERRFTGWADIGLTNQGKNEAKYAGQLIKNLNINFDTFFSSKLKRATNTMEIILKILNINSNKVIKAKELNERHYGGLTSLNKDETIKKYGKKQVHIWRRSFDIPPPPLEKDHPFKNKIKSSILSESLKDTFERVTPYYKKKVEPLLKKNKNILIVFHGNSCRAMLKNILNISNKKITKLEIPTGNPLMIKFKDDFKISEYMYLDKTRSKKIFFNS